MNILNLVKITPLLISGLVGINKANITENIFSFSITRTSTAIMSYTIAIKSKSTVWPNAIFNITFKETNNTSPSYIINSRNFNTESSIQGTTNLQIDVNFIENIDLQSASITENGTNPGTAINEENNSLYFIINPLMFETNEEITYTINADTNPIEPEPPEEDPYKNYSNYEIPQASLQTIRLNNTFSSYDDILRFNKINITKNEIIINIIRTDQFAKITYTNKEIYLPILGTFIQNKTQYNIVDIYLTNGQVLLNLLNRNSSVNKFFVSETRQVQQSKYIYKNCSFNYFNKTDKPNKLNYESTENNTIQITTNDVGTGNIGNATITNKDSNISYMQMYSLFGINPTTTSYFGGQNPTRINQNKTGGSVSAMIGQIVEMTNYNEYLQMFTYRNDVDQTQGQLYIPLSNMENVNDLHINLVAFKTSIGNNPELAINDITTLFGVLDNLETLGYFPFTFGTIIFIGVIFGFIMILVKILK